MSQLGNIVLKDGILPHASVHGWRYDNRRLCREKCCRQHIVTYPSRQLPYDICRGRGDEDNIGELGQRDMFHAEVKVAVECVDDALMACQCLECHRRDEVACVVCHDDMHVGMELDKHGGEIGNLIGRNAACDAEKDGLS